MLSIVIPTYNRFDVVIRSIESAIHAFSRIIEFEIIVIDDASTDSTVKQIQAKFPAEITAKTVLIETNHVNRGVTGSRNRGYLLSKGEWVIFLDSDDILLSSSGLSIVETLHANSSKPIVFFRCIDHAGEFVGKKINQEINLDLKKYVKNVSFGESLVVINRLIVAELPFDEALRGYEGLSLTRIIKKYGPALLSPIIARRYDRSRSDRLSSQIGFCNRLPLLARGHFLMILEFHSEMALIQVVSYLLKAIFYLVVFQVWKIFK